MKKTSGTLKSKAVKKASKSTPRAKSTARVTPAVKKQVTPSRQAASGGQKKKLLAELVKISTELDEKGLSFLIQQARVLEHNLQVERIGRDRKKADIVDQIRQKSTRSDKRTIDVKEADDGSSFVLIINNARNFFALDEMRRLVGICHGSADENDAGRRLYNWLTLHRKDVLIDTDITGAADEALITIYRFLINRYKLKE